MNKVELIAELDYMDIPVSEFQVRKWIVEGLPYEKYNEKEYNFNLKKVKQWLRENKDCDIDDPYFLTLMTAEELSEETGMSRATICMCCKKKGLPFTHFANGRKAYDLSKVLEWANKHKEIKCVRSLAENGQH